jgi:hypothetical protein
LARAMANEKLRFCLFPGFSFCDSVFSVLHSHTLENDLRNGNHIFLPHPKLLEN